MAGSGWVYINIIYYVCCIGYLSHLHREDQSEAVICFCDVNLIDNQRRIHDELSLYHNLYGKGLCNVFYCKMLCLQT